MAHQSTLDWGGIEREYRAGQLSLSAIARLYGCTRTAIQKRIKKDGWVQDLKEKVQARAESRLASDDLSDEIKESIKADRKGAQPRKVLGDDEPPLTEEETVEAAAARVVMVVREHRRTLKVGREIVNALMTELQETTENIDNIRQEIDVDAANNDKKRTTMLRSVSLATRAGVIVNLSAAMKNLITLERQAFSITDKQEDLGNIKIELVNYAEADDSSQVQPETLSDSPIEGV